ncbi:MAG: helix-turn-helix transcriptional regulator [Clostridia bacterium]|nr:helix-turn-helix transcriptional regulator [Clostridia bacterium]
MELILGKIVAIGLYNSSVVVKNRTVTKTRKTTMFELELPVLKGGISYVDNTERQIIPNMVICSKPGQARHSRLPYMCYYVHMIVKDCELADILNSLPVFIDIDKYDEYLDIFKSLVKYYNTASKLDEIKLNSLLLELIYKLICDSKKDRYQSKAKSNNHQAIERVIKYIDQNLTGELSLDELANLAGYSRVHFHNCFKASTGMRLREYVEEQRIKKAANLLLSTDYSLTKIAYECGFSSQSYFNFAFKRKMHQTPREYAKEMSRRYEDNT